MITTANTYFPDSHPVMHTPVYFLKVGDTISGPHTGIALREMASIHAFSDDAMISPDMKKTWYMISEHPELRAQLFPEARRYSLKNKCIEVVNKPSVDGPIAVESILQGSVEFQRKAERPVDLSFPRNKRRRDYLFAFALFNTIGAAGAYWLPHEPFVLAALGCYFMLANFGIYWVFYQIMDRY